MRGMARLRYETNQERSFKDGLATIRVMLEDSMV